LGGRGSNWGPNRKKEGESEGKEVPRRGGPNIGGKAHGVHLRGGEKKITKEGGGRGKRKKSKGLYLRGWIKIVGPYRNIRRGGLLGVKKGAWTRDIDKAENFWAQIVWEEGGKRGEKSQGGEKKNVTRGKLIILAKGVGQNVPADTGQNPFETGGDNWFGKNP